MNVKNWLQQSTSSSHDFVNPMKFSVNASINFRDSNKNTEIHKAIYDNQSNILELLLKCGANPNQVNRHYLTPLHVAINEVNVECVDI
ncbi:ankyrin repeat domain-containing protein [Wolbachia endosymbiont of Pentidionis agamae]|uniref:ankyrin repeat domain-containing protein n=1 Tax=Wolbachia endosymbiont of Pentidionis agamae TaxID=3110435 RepID=UPI0038CDBA21